ncbi:hypothetical protein [Amycolatopsis sp. ATCC 39116]|uniref:DUF6932 family protein n=1 Tax=Amycolatopsis sp. (strain ATCC 39116 / 75iv2) TaxID=385957 RepID=UPI00036D6792|nr:hypothetical protein [Amycolatopsis sp. ATCC 39116]
MALPVPALDDATGYLPVGRHHCTIEEFRSAFVDAEQFTGTQRRKEIWTHWERAKVVLGRLVPVYAAWISGSYVSSKPEPDDMDIVFVIDGLAAERLVADEPTRARYLTAFAQGKRFHQPAGRRLDTYLVQWRPILKPGPTMTDDEVSYYQSRGHWDDFWQRCRAGAKDSPIVVADTIPQRGYLEVKLDDYPR